MAQDNVSVQQRNGTSHVALKRPFNPGLENRKPLPHGSAERNFVRAIQDRRKEIGCHYTDRIVVGIVTDSDELLAAIRRFEAYIKRETLAVELGTGSVEGAEPVQLEAAGHELTLRVKVVTPS